MKTVWKTVLEWPADEQTVYRREGAELLTVQPQGNSLCLWARVDPEARQSAFIIRTAGTGHPLADDVGDYISTFQLAGGSLVFHAFGKEIA